MIHNMIISHTCMILFIYESLSVEPNVYDRETNCLTSNYVTLRVCESGRQTKPDLTYIEQLILNVEPAGHLLNVGFSRAKNTNQTSYTVYPHNHETNYQHLKADIFTEIYIKHHLRPAIICVNTSLTLTTTTNPVCPES